MGHLWQAALGCSSEYLLQGRKVCICIYILFVPMEVGMRPLSLTPLLQTSRW